MTKKKSKLIIVQCTSLAFSLVSLFAGAYAWYSANRQASLSVTSISAESGISFDFYYFNYNSGQGYEPANIDDTEVLFPSAFTKDTTASFSIPKFAPKHRYTYALKITSGFAYQRSISLLLSRFTSIASNSKFFYIGDDNTAAAYGIRLAEAINIYGKSYDLMSSTTVDVTDQITSEEGSADLAKTSFYTNPKNDSTTVFAPDAPIASCTSGGSDTSTKVIIFSVEFSNAASTFYSGTPDSSTDGKDYYLHDTDGNSNVYSSLLDSDSFCLNNLTLSPDNIAA